MTVLCVLTPWHLDGPFLQLPASLASMSMLMVLVFGRACCFGMARLQVCVGCAAVFFLITAFGAKIMLLCAWCLTSVASIDSDAVKRVPPSWKLLCVEERHGAKLS